MLRRFRVIALFWRDYPRRSGATALRYSRFIPVAFRGAFARDRCCRSLCLVSYYVINPYIGRCRH